MNYPKLFALSLLSIVLLASSCGNSETKNDENDFNEIYNQLDTLKNELAVEDENNWRNFFQIKVPEPMFEMNQLNKEAVAQYGYIEEVQSDSKDEVEVLEHYLIIMMETKADIANYPTDMEFDAASYYDNVMQSLRESKDEFDEVVDDPEVTTINGLNAVHNEAIAGMRVKGEWIDLFYEIAVVEGNNAFYQIITWCPNGQREIFETDMELIINSFKEKSDAPGAEDTHDHNHDHAH